MQKPVFPYPVAEGFLSPESVIANFDLKPGDAIIDFGCGAGFWTVPMARIVKSKGKVVAIDPSTENLSLIKSKSESFGLSNIEFVKAPYASKNLPTTTKADLILISNVLSIIDTDKELIESCKANAKKGTKLVVVDWDAKTQNALLKKKEFVDIESVMTYAESAGFSFKRLLNAGRDHFALLFEKE